MDFYLRINTNMLTLNNIKDALKIDYSDDDIELRRLQQAVISMIESYCYLVFASSQNRIS